jgi:hypothetical protein
MAQRSRIAGDTCHTRPARVAPLIRPVGPRARGPLLGRPPSISAIHPRWMVGSNFWGYIKEETGRVLTLTPFTSTIFRERGGSSGARCASRLVAVAGWASGGTVAPVRCASAPHRWPRSLRARLHEDATRPTTYSSPRHTAPSSGGLTSSRWMDFNRRLHPGAGPIRSPWLRCPVDVNQARNGGADPVHPGPDPAKDRSDLVGCGGLWQASISAANLC